MARNKLITQTIVGISALAVAGVLVWGVAEGRLSADVASGSGDTNSVFSAAGTSSESSVEGGVLALSEDRRSIAVLDPGNGTLRGRIELEKPAAHMQPTPGGVSVFVTFPDSPEIRVYSTTDYNLQERITVDGGVPAELTFSENGSTLFVAYRNSPRVSGFSHSQLQLSDPYHFEGADAPGPVVRNRRATRLYRQTDAGLGVIYAQNGALIETLDVDARQWQFNASHSHLWGVGTDGRPRVVAERSGNITIVQRELAAGAGGAALAPVGRAGNGSVGSSRAGNGSQTGGASAGASGGGSTARAGGGDGTAGRVAALLSGGESVALFDGATAAELGEVELPFAAQRLAPSGLGTVWAVAEDGRVAVIDPYAETVAAVHESDLSGAAQIAPSIVKEGGGFACFS
jgi:hypothetical protein